jgi:hypothetical protein
MLYLLSEPKYISCLRLSEIMGGLSHDSINRFLLREEYSPEDLFEEVKKELILEGGTLSVDDSVGNWYRLIKVGKSYGVRL